MKNERNDMDDKSQLTQKQPSISSIIIIIINFITCLMLGTINPLFVSTAIPISLFEIKVR